eukprot:1712492-Rhodomonas_salina.3
MEPGGLRASLVHTTVQPEGSDRDESTSKDSDADRETSALHGPSKKPQENGRAVAEAVAESTAAIAALALCVRRRRELRLALGREERDLLRPARGLRVLERVRDDQGAVNSGAEVAARVVGVVISTAVHDERMLDQLRYCRALHRLESKALLEKRNALHRKTERVHWLRSACCIPQVGLLLLLSRPPHQELQSHSADAPHVHALALAETRPLLGALESETTFGIACCARVAAFVALGPSVQSLRQHFDISRGRIRSEQRQQQDRSEAEEREWWTYNADTSISNDWSRRTGLLQLSAGASWMADVISGLCESRKSGMDFAWGCENSCRGHTQSAHQLRKKDQHGPEQGGCRGALGSDLCEGLKRGDATGFVLLGSATGSKAFSYLCAKRLDQSGSVPDP